MTAQDILIALGTLLGTGIAAAIAAYRQQQKKTKQKLEETDDLALINSGKERAAIIARAREAVEQMRSQYDAMQSAAEAWERIASEGDKQIMALRIECESRQREIDRQRNEILSLQRECLRLRDLIDTEDVK